MAFPSWLRPCAAICLAAGLLGLGSGCHRSTGLPAGTINLSGTVTFTRTPVVYDTSSDPATSGQPTGYGAPAAAAVARGVVVRAFLLVPDIDSSGRLNQVWRLVGSTVTDINGLYQLNGFVYQGYSAFVEVDGVFQMASGNDSSVKIIADPAGITSSLPEPMRPIWALRKDMAGNPVTNPVVADPLTTTSTVAVATVDATVNFLVGTTDSWVATVSNWYVPGTNPNYPGSSTQPQAPPTETLALGSKVLGILDNVYNFANLYGDPTPSQGRGGVFDLHYHPGVTEPARRSYVVYDRQMTPLADTGTLEANGTTEKFAYFGTLAGGPAVDDAWDPGVIYPMLARNFLFGQGKTALFPTGRSSLLSLSPDLAVVDGMGDAMAATLLTTPWLTDITSPVPLAPRDIRVIPASPGLGSPGTLAALAWQLSLTGNNITPPGTYANWSATWSYGTPTGLTFPPVMARLFDLEYPYVQTQGINGEVTQRTDIISIYGQAARLQEPQNGNPVDLAKTFSNLELFTQLNPFNLQWPLTPQAWPFIATDWNSGTYVVPGPMLPTLPSFTLSMAQAQQIPNPAITDPVPALVYPNCSQGEVAYTKLALYLDQSFQLSLATSPSLPAGAAIEVLVDGAIAPPALPNPQPQRFLFTAGNLGPVPLSLAGNPTDYTNPTWHWIRFRMISPTVQQPDVLVTPTLQ